MSKTCNYPECNNPVFSHLYCKYHQWCRTDQQQSKKLRTSPIPHRSEKKWKQIESFSKINQAFHALVLAIKQPYCIYCINAVPSDLPGYTRHHVFEKSIYPHLHYEIEDIAIACLDCHTQLTAHRYTDRMKEVMEFYAERLISMGLLEQIGEPDYYNPRNWVIKPLAV